MVAEKTFAEPVNPTDPLRKWFCLKEGEIEAWVKDPSKLFDIMTALENYFYECDEGKTHFRVVPISTNVHRDMEQEAAKKGLLGFIVSANKPGMSSRIGAFIAGWMRRESGSPPSDDASGTFIGIGD